MVSLTSAENALKEVYLGIVANQLNVAANPLLAQIKRSTNHIYGKEVRKAAPIGINGGIGAGDEAGALPTPSETNYASFIAELKNLYGKIEISDKALRATSNNVNSFINLLNDEMEKLIESSNFNLGRMLFGDGSGTLVTVQSVSTINKQIKVTGNINNVVEGMVVQNPANSQLFHITYVDKVNNSIYVSEEASQITGAGIQMGIKLVVQGSKDKEITGIEGLFSNTTLYGLTKTDNRWLNPYSDSTLTYLSDAAIQTVIDNLEDNTNSNINYIATTKAIRRLYQEYLGAYRRNIDVTELAGGFKTITYNGIPVVGDKFVNPNTMYFLNTDDFTIYEMCDWKWLEDESGRILKQNPNYPTYSATLVKYAELVCEKPAGQGKLSNIATTLTEPVEDDSTGS